MNSIWKFQLELRDAQSVQIPQGAKLLTVQMQDGEPCLWAEVDPSAVKESRAIELVGTGHPILCDRHAYISSCQQGPFVWHWFERLP
jgi:hypothetical protein